MNRGKNGKFIKKDQIENIIPNNEEMNEQESWVFSLITIALKTCLGMIIRLFYNSLIFILLAMIIRNIGIFEFAKESFGFAIEILNAIKDIGNSSFKPSNSTNSNGETPKTGYFS